MAPIRASLSSASPKYFPSSPNPLRCDPRLIRALALCGLISSAWLFLFPIHPPETTLSVAPRPALLPPSPYGGARALPPTPVAYGELLGFQDMDREFRAMNAELSRRAQEMQDKGLPTTPGAYRYERSEEKQLQNGFYRSYERIEVRTLGPTPAAAAPNVGMDLAVAAVAAMWLAGAVRLIRNIDATTFAEDKALQVGLGWPLWYALDGAFRRQFHAAVLRGGTPGPRPPSSGAARPSKSAADRGWGEPERDDWADR